MEMWKSGLHPSDSHISTAPTTTTATPYKFESDSDSPADPRLYRDCTEEFRLSMLSLPSVSGSAVYP